MILIKLGGSVLKDEGVLKALSRELVQLQAAGISPIIVHGGGPAINEELKFRRIPWEFNQGLRITPKPMMDVIEMVLCGKINRKLVRTLNAAGASAIGISGVDGNLLQCIPADPHLGQVGQIEQVNTQLLHLLLAPRSRHAPLMIPVIAPIGIDSEGNAFNINADWAASKIAQSMGIQQLIYITDQDGILDSEGRTIPQVDDQELHQLIEQQTVHGGMLAKVRTILDALSNQVPEIHIVNAQRPQALKEAIFNQPGPRSFAGTTCQRRDEPKRSPNYDPTQDQRSHHGRGAQPIRNPGFDPLCLGTQERPKGRPTPGIFAAKTAGTALR